MVLGWKRPGRVGRRRIPLGAVATCCRAFHIEIESRSDSISSFVRSNTFFPSPRKLHRIAAQFAYGVPSPALAAASGSAVCHLLPRYSHRNRVEKRLDFFLCSKQYFLPISPQIAPDSGAICLRCAIACACSRERQCGLPLAAANGSAVCHLLPRLLHRNRVEKRLDFFLCSKQYFLPISPQIAPDSGAICFVCVCLRHNIELVWVFGGNAIR